MQCLICGSEEMKVNGNVKRGIKTDLRQRQCVDCGAIYTAFENLFDIIIDGEQVPLASLDRETVQAMQDAYMSKKVNFLRNQLTLFNNAENN